MDAVATDTLLQLDAVLLAVAEGVNKPCLKRVLAC